MRINNFSDVSLRLLMVLCSAPSEDLPTTRELAETVETPYHHVSKAVLKLRQMGLVEAIRGRSGGVRITPEGRKATVGGVLRALDDHSDVAACQTVAGECPLIHGCGLRGALNHAREAFYASLDDLAVGSLVRGAQTAPVAVTLSTRPES